MRIVSFLILILILLLTAHVIYYRSKADKLLAKALRELPRAPAQSYKIIQPVLDYGDLETLGKAGAARNAYLKRMEQSMNDSFSGGPTAETYDQALQAVQALVSLRKQTRVDTSAIQAAIVQQAKDSAPRLREQGTLNAWDAMIRFFDHLKQNDLIPFSVFENFDVWVAGVKAVPRRPLGLRDAINNTSACIRDALQHLGLMATSAAGPIIQPAPVALADKQLIAAELAFNQGLAALNRFQQLFKEPQLPPELIALKAKIEYNKGAIKLAHIQDRGPRLSDMGSNYISELLIRPGVLTVPTTSEMVMSFGQGTQMAFDGAEQYFIQASTLPDPLRRAYVALAIWGKAMLLAATGQDQPDLRAQAGQWAAGASGSAAAIVRAMQSSRRVLIIVQLP